MRAAKHFIMREYMPKWQVINSTVCLIKRLPNHEKTRVCVSGSEKMNVFCSTAEMACGRRGIYTWYIIYIYIYISFRRGGGELFRRRGRAWFNGKRRHTGEGRPGEVGHVDKTAGVDSVPLSAVKKKIRLSGYCDVYR